MKYDVVTIRMSRSAANIPWGFSIRAPGIIRNVEGGSLADKAGLQNGDLVDELQYERNPSYERLQDLMNSAKNELDIIVMREPSVARIWQPTIQSTVPDRLTTQTPRSNYQPPITNSYQVSFQHQPLQSDGMHGFNQPPRQFDVNKSAAKLDHQTPAYLRSEALKLIQENEKTPPNQTTTLTPECFCCGRLIIGLMCQAFDKNMHPDCFQCSTCGSALAQQGHHFINEKFYCNVHGNQRRNQQLNSETETRRSEAPLTQSVRPFNSNGSLHEDRSKLASNRFNPTTEKPFNSTNGNPSTRGFAGALSGRQNVHKAPVFRRRILKTPWPPPPGRIQRTADAQRYWKYTFDGTSTEGLSTRNLKSVISDFECGRMAEIANTIRRRPPNDHPLAKRVVNTPDRLSTPMRRNPFAWSNAELPSKPMETSCSSSFLNLMPSSSSVTLTAAGDLNGNEADVDEEITEEIAEVESTNLIDISNENAEVSAQPTNWKYRAEIVEERDILTASSTSSPGTSISPIDKDEVDGDLTPTFEFEEDETNETMVLSLQQQNSNKLSTTLLSPINEEIDEYPELLNEQTVHSSIKNESLKSKSTTSSTSRSHLRPFVRGFSTVQLAERPVQIVSSVQLQDTSSLNYSTSVVDKDANVVTYEQQQPERTKIRIQPSTTIQSFNVDEKAKAQTSTVSNEKESRRENRLQEMKNETQKLDDLLVTLQLEANRLDAAAHELSIKRYESTTNQFVPINTESCEIVYEDNLIREPKNDEICGQVETTFNITTLERIETLELKKPQKSAIMKNNINSVVPLFGYQNGSNSRLSISSLNRRNSTEDSIDLPPPMPHFHSTTSILPNYLNGRSRSSTPAHLQDCLLRTSSFLSLLTRLEVLNERRIHPHHTQTMELLEEAEAKVGEFDVQYLWSHPKPNSRRVTASYNSALSSSTSNASPFSRQIDQSTGEQRGQLLNHTGQPPRCEFCHKEISGSFVLATGKTWCQEHFRCANAICNRQLLDCGFVEEDGKKYCEKCFETLIAPACAKCGLAITADCLNALQRQWHPECFTCQHCRRPFGNTAFYLENGQPYCEKDWNQLFTTKCVSCKFPIEAGDRWIEAIGSAFHSNCFNCHSCNVNLEGQNFYARDGHPFCRAHS
ncbi:PDZ and LIM domain protein Zasp [Aphelenchoides besseyi]|nr:PDZ and LIM domain protein Zasp [Aphelenchoides besseyi]KAI6202043.1 PDZ and LIM domain protein Zasp [Aphelenchoides besseyi]